MCGGYRIYMISGSGHHFKRKKKKERLLWEISNIHDNRVISKERKKIERILWGILNIHDIRMGASFQKKERKKKERILWEISNIHDIRLGASFHAGCSYYSLPGDRKHYSGDYHRRNISMKEMSYPRCFFLVA